ncbi:unnamed protein product [Laminaria digitata]
MMQELGRTRLRLRHPSHRRRRDVKTHCTTVGGIGMYIRDIPETYQRHTRGGYERHTGYERREAGAAAEAEGKGKLLSLVGPLRANGSCVLGRWTAFDSLAYSLFCLSGSDSDSLLGLAFLLLWLGRAADWVGRGC